MKITVMVLASLIVMGCATDLSTHTTSTTDIIYKKGNTSILEVFNLGQSWFSTEDVRYLQHRDAKYGEFGGKIDQCSDAKYFCLIGGIGVAIPRQFSGQSAWQFSGQNCSAESPLTSDEIATITCSRGNWSNRISYSRSRGIVSYTKLAQPNYTYELVDERGLFAVAASAGN
jgi:hypothetical protein